MHEENAYFLTHELNYVAGKTFFNSGHEVGESRLPSKSDFSLPSINYLVHIPATQISRRASFENATCAPKKPATWDCAWRGVKKPRSKRGWFASIASAAA